MKPSTSFYVSKFKYFVAFSFPCSSGESIGQCISGIYTWSLTVVGILAFFQIIYAGVMYLTAAGKASQITQAKSKIWKAILGIIILFSSYLILYTINPDLVGGEFKLPLLKDETAKQDYNSLYLQKTVQSSAVKGQEYSSVIRPAGGTPPYKFEIVEGSLPPGLRMESNEEEATISGTPADQTPYLSPFNKLARLIKITPAEAAARDYTFKVKITDSQGKTFFETMTISVEVEDEVAGGEDGGGPTPTAITTTSPLPEPGDFGKAVQTEFIQEIEISDKGSHDPVLFPAGSEISLRAKKLYKIKFRVDISKVSPFIVKSGSQWVAVPPSAKIISSTHIEYIDHTKIVHNKRAISGREVVGYPMELLKISDRIISLHNYFVEAEKRSSKDKIFNLQPILSKGIAKGTTFLAEGERKITVSGSDKGGPPSDSTLNNIYRLFESVPVQGYIYIPESELGKKIDLTVELLGKGKDSKLVKDKRIVSLSIDSVNRPPVVYSQICATSIRGKEECDFPHLKDISWFSQWQLYLVSLDGKKTYDPDGDGLRCIWLDLAFTPKGGFYPSPINPPGCSSPGLGRADPYSATKTAGDYWINWWPGLGRSSIRLETNYRTNEFGEADGFVISDGSLLSDVYRFELSAGKEPGKKYPLAGCDPTRYGAERVVYASGVSIEFQCTRVAEPSAGPWLWRGAGNLDGDPMDFGGCSGTVGQNAVLEYSPVAGGAKWKCEKAGQFWRLKQISSGSGGGPVISAKLEPLVSKELKVKAGDKVLLKIRLVDSPSNKLDTSTINWALLKIGSAINLNLPISASYNSNTKISQAEFTAPNQSILFNISVKVKLEGGGLGEIFENFRIDVSK